MIKKIVFLFCFIFFTASYVNAIEWSCFTTPLNKTVCLDIDSITEYNNYFFYNIKYKRDVSNKEVITTIQSGKNSAFSARLKTYTLSEYESLNGDYSNITSNYTTNLEPVTFESIVNTCYKKVKEIYNLKNASKINII